MNKIKWNIGLLALLIVGCGDPKNTTSAADCSPGDAEIHDGQTYCVYRGSIIETRFDCPDFAPFQHELRDMIICSPRESLPPIAGWETTEPGFCDTSSGSFRVFPNLCELVDVSCGGGQILTHQSNSTAQVGDKIITTHVFLDANGASVEVFEECGTVCSGNEEMTTVAGGCRLEDVIEGDAFIVFEADPNSAFPKYLVEVFRTDLVDGVVTDAFGGPTKFADLADVQSKWASTSEPFAQGCGVPEGWCAEDFMIYE